MLYILTLGDSSVRLEATIGIAYRRLTRSSPLTGTTAARRSHDNIVSSDLADPPSSSTKVQRRHSQCAPITFGPWTALFQFPGNNLAIFAAAPCHSFTEAIAAAAVVWRHESTYNVLVAALCRVDKRRQEATQTPRLSFCSRFLRLWVIAEWCRWGRNVDEGDAARLITCNEIQAAMVRAMCG